MSTDINGTPVLEWTCNYPDAGMWMVDVIATSGTALKKGALATITCGGLALHGKVARSGNDAVDRPHSIVVGGGGWLTSVDKPQAFQSDAGVRLASVVRACTVGSGETIEGLVDRTIGDCFMIVASRPNEPVTYRDVLDDLVREGALPNWRVDPDGVTRLGFRKGSAVTVRATDMRRNMGLGIITYGLDDPSQLLPGNTIDGEPIRSLRISEKEGKLTAHVCFAESAPSTMELVRRAVQKYFTESSRTYIVKHCYSDGRCDLVAPADSPHLPPLNKIEQWILGVGIVKLESGDTVTIKQRDDRSSRPVITNVRAKRNGGTYIEGALKGSSVQVLMPPLIFSGTIGGEPAAGVMASPLSTTLGTVMDGTTKAAYKP